MRRPELTALMLGLLTAGMTADLPAAETGGPESRAGTGGQEAISPGSASTARPAAWAQPVTVAGMANLHLVAPGLYRSAQPTSAGLAAMEAVGLRTVLNLRRFHDDEDEAGLTRLRRFDVEMNAWDVEEDEVVRALVVIRDPANRPCLFHCQHGADRTGVVCAMYRMVEQGWSREDAIAEMTGGGYGFHPMWKNLVRYLQTVDVAGVRRKVEALAATGAEAGPAAGGAPAR